MNKQLTISIMPDRTIHPEWENTLNKLSDKTIGTQHDLEQGFLQEGLLYLGFCESDKTFSASLDYFIGFARLFIEKLSRISDLETLRHEAVVDLSENEWRWLIESVPLVTGAEYITPGMLKELWAGLRTAFREQIQDYDDTVAAFFHEKNPAIHLAGRVFFHLVENKNNPAQPFAFMATYSAGMGGDGTPRHLPLKHAIEAYDQDDLLRLLSTVYRAAEKSELVDNLIDSGELFYPLAWEPQEAFRFLKEIPIYEAAGVLCRMPDWWKPHAKAVGLNISFGDTKPSFVGMDALIDFKPNLLLGDTVIGADDARRMLETAEGLAFIKNKWVVVDHEKLNKALAAYHEVERMAAEGMTFGEAMRLQLQPEKILDAPEEDLNIGVSNGTWMASVLDKLRTPGQAKNIKPGKGFSAKLRPYQIDGLNWLAYLDSLNFGACLADDMGLGKTIQILALLSTFKHKAHLPASLLIVPASLISNWVAEIEKFYPVLKVHVAHPGFTSGNGRRKSNTVEKSAQELDRIDLVITSYALAKRYDWLDAYRWHYVILDEAQAIKNPVTKQTRAVKKLKARNRIIMTGTPVENRISDLWSLFDFLNSGLLGDKKEFGAFAKALRDHPQSYAHLRKIVSPYILRRLKTDKSVIRDLPDKVEMKTYADLSKKQIVLYNRSVQSLKKTVEDAEGIQRKGLVLAALMKFKQLCNHPDQLSGSGAYKETDSGKFLRLRPICETIYDKRERVLVFTQFKEMTEPLRAFLETIFHHKGLVLHGSVAVAKRKKLIQTFQADAYCPFMVLSLKAGGVGLNLTKANHVVHFDRWWNPAVENQATDRAFRIGQKKKVVVHKFVTRGTIEERIEEMIEEKKEMADQLVSPTGEALITEMDNARLMNLFKLAL